MNFDKEAKSDKKNWGEGGWGVGGGEGRHYDLCQGEVDAVKRGPKLNLIKNLGKVGGGGG